MNILKENEEKKLHEISKYLLERETITGEEFMEILNGEKPSDKIEEKTQTQIILQIKMKLYLKEVSFKQLTKG